MRIMFLTNKEKELFIINYKATSRLVLITFSAFLVSVEFFRWLWKSLTFITSSSTPDHN